MKTILLSCGILSSMVYVLMNIFIPLQFEGYSYSVHTVSELSAINAPTRHLWVISASIYILLFAAFSVGVWKSAGTNKSLRIVGMLMFVYAAVNFYWPPMHLRGNEATLTDALHIFWAIITILLMLLMMGFGAAAMGRKFKIYTIASIIGFIGFGVLTSLEAPNIPVDGPTPWIGVWERINIGIFMAWVIVLSVVLLQKNGHLKSPAYINFGWLRPMQVKK